MRAGHTCQSDISAAGQTYSSARSDAERGPCVRHARGGQPFVSHSKNDI